MKQFVRVLYLFPLMICVSVAAHAVDEIEQFTLKNGMEVVVVPNHRVPAVSHTIWYRVGGADDPAGASGLSHYLEHMMFQGTKKHPDDSYSRLISKMGGQNNAFTGHDYTAYYVNIAKEKLPKVMELESDRMQNLNPLNDDFLRERQVILEERKMTIDNKPVALLGEQMAAALYLNHPYHTSIIGWRHEMEKLTGVAAMSHYRRYYQPANAILVVAGDITARELRPLAEKYYGVLPSAKAPVRVWKEEPAQIAERHLVMRHANVSQSTWFRHYLAPSLVSGDTAQAMPLTVFAQALGGGETSRLYQSLVVEKKVAVGVGADYSPTTYGPAEFGFYAVPAEGVSIESLETYMQEAIADALKTPLSTEEIARAKTQLKAETIYARDSLEGVANFVGALRALSLPVTYFTDWEKLVDAVTKEQIQEAAQKVLKPESSVTAWLLPVVEAKP